jgi:RNA polymerase sigma factor (TIGR02999 family)
MLAACCHISRTHMTDPTIHDLEFSDEANIYASEKLLPMVYEELRRLAAFRLKNEFGNQTLQPTALVHEAWLRIAGNDERSWEDQVHFFNAAALAMRRILVERARGKARIKRRRPDDLSFMNQDWTDNDDHIIMIHECLTLLENSDPESAKVVLLKFYGGLSSSEIGQMTGRSMRSVERQWMYAKAQLYRLISKDQT